jgi:predicted aldo/keto reductase-like oxidoreductase
LGYGMMRLPVEGGGTFRDHPDAGIDQEMVNEQVDYALEHGINYFDTSPAYCKGLSERSTGIALSYGRCCGSHFGGVVRLQKQRRIARHRQKRH